MNRTHLRIGGTAVALPAPGTGQGPYRPPDPLAGVATAVRQAQPPERLCAPGGLPSPPVPLPACRPDGDPGEVTTPCRRVHNVPGPVPIPDHAFCRAFAWAAAPGGSIT